MIETECPHCGYVLRIPEKYTGQTGRWKHCREPFMVVRTWD